MTKLVERAFLLFGRMRRMATMFVKDPRAAKALATWPKFSISSYTMVSRLQNQGIVARTVLDVGANTGQFAVASAKLFPKAQIHSFEPIPECVYELQDNVTQLGNVHIYPCALGEEEDTLEFHVNSFSPSSSLLPLSEAHRKAFPNAYEQHTIEVDVSTLDLVIEKIDLEPPILLKLDVQGYEAHTLRGGTETLNYVDYVVLEASFKPMYVGEPTFMEIARMMEEYGFRFERPIGWLSTEGTGEVVQMDALFVREG